ncbi:GTP-binding protein [Cellvibrio sp. OA-2007]|uniref:GTP-binding protein n=1 Tax=Cellvibrio sp. OA-2007 TaxID=529823 RepID=UPI000AF51FFA|nr:GTP-binding protein [Cellvibrio sp. OA-2007]
MRKCITPLTLFLWPWLALVSVAVQAQHKLEPLWLTPDLPTPESVLYVADKKEPYLFVALIDGQGDGVDGKGGIATLATDGTVIDKNWLTGLNAPKGMAQFKNRLYVADITELVVIDIKKRKVIKKIPIADSVFLNDVTVNSSGVVFVSDTRTNKVHRIEKDEPSLYLENMTSANGLKVFGSNLIVGAGKELLLVGADKKPLSVATGFAQGIDGIEMVARGEFIVSCWPGLVYYVYRDGKIELLIDSQADKINTADIGYDPNTQQVFVPNFFKNSVTAYQLK